MTPDQELAAFEAWAMYKADLQKGSAGEYVDIFARVMLDAWQARAAIEAYAQALATESRAKHYGDGYEAGWNAALEEAAKLIEADGTEEFRVCSIDRMAKAIRTLKREQS
jgi:hypothetical protein